MTEDEKRKFDAWESLRDHAWREFEDKSRAEWRLSFGIWAALLASMSALIASSKPLAGNLMKEWPCVLIFLAVAIPGGHIYFLYWIQTKFGEARKILAEAQNGMREMLGAASLTTKPRSNWKQVPMWIESGITILLIAVLYVVLKYSARWARSAHAVFFGFRFSFPCVPPSSAGWSGVVRRICLST